MPRIAEEEETEGSEVISKSKISLAMIGFAVAGVFLTAGHASADTKVYKVKGGDTLSKIAKEHRTTVDKLAKDNGIENINLIIVGDKISVNGTLLSKSDKKDEDKVAKQTPVSTTKQEVVVSEPVAQANLSVYDQFIQAGGTQEMWDVIVMPESGGNPNATNGKYYGLFQGDVAYGWPTGDVATQTKGAINYAVERYGSISGAIAFRIAHNWW